MKLENFQQDLIDCNSPKLFIGIKSFVRLYYCSLSFSLAGRKNKYISVQNFKFLLYYQFKKSLLKYLKFRYADALKSPTDEQGTKLEYRRPGCQVELRTRPKSEFFRKSSTDQTGSFTTSTSSDIKSSSGAANNRPLSCDIATGSSSAASTRNRVAPTASSAAADDQTVSSWAEGQLIMDMYILGGREVGQVTVFKRPLSVWKLDLTSLS